MQEFLSFDSMLRYRKIDRLLDEYGESHRHETNKAIHWICVPAIFFSTIGLLASIPAAPLQSLTGYSHTLVNWATLAMIPVLIYYFLLSRPLALGMLVFCAGCLVLAAWVDRMTILWMVSLIIFITAWVSQLYGHQIEGKKPSFFKDLQFLLIGPAWLMHFIFRRLGLRY